MPCRRSRLALSCARIACMESAPVDRFESVTEQAFEIDELLRDALGVEGEPAFGQRLLDFFHPLSVHVGRGGDALPQLLQPTRFDAGVRFAVDMALAVAGGGA